MTVLAVFSPPPCGEGSGVGVDSAVTRVTPLPNPPPQGGREQAADATCLTPRERIA
jgi:precorrin-3B synthase